MSQSFESQFRNAARAVGYRFGKAAAKRQLAGETDGYAPEFGELFQPEYALDAERGYAKGWVFVKENSRKSHLTTTP